MGKGKMMIGFSDKKNTKNSQGMVLHAYNPSTQEAETKESQ